MTLDKFGKPYGSSWEGMSMGEGGIKVKGWPGDCPTSTDPEKRHIVTVMWNVQSVEHFKCNFCGEEWSD